MPDAAETTRDRLLEAARELFTTAGYHATTTPMLARRAGVAEGTIYRYFQSKHALLNAAMQEVQGWGLARIRAHQGVPGPTGDRLSALGREWLEVAEQDPARMRMLLCWRLPGELDEASVASIREIQLGIEAMLALGKQEGTVRAGVVELWATVWVALIALAVERVARHEWTGRHSHALALLDAAWEAIAWRPIAQPPVGGSATHIPAAAS